MSGHTKGPWEFKDRGHSWVIVADGSAIMGNEQYYPWVPNDEDDWHLIAAAPDLLEALELAVQQIRGEGFDPDPSCIAAIARARGES